MFTNLQIIRKKVTSTSGKPYMFFLHLQVKLECLIGGCNNNKGKGISASICSASNLLKHVKSRHKMRYIEVAKHVGKFDKIPVSIVTDFASTNSNYSPHGDEVLTNSLTKQHPQIQEKPRDMALKSFTGNANSDEYHSSQSKSSTTATEIPKLFKKYEPYFTVLKR